MFDISWPELLVILVVALIVMPRVARILGRWFGKARAMANEFQDELAALERQVEVDKIRTEINKAGRVDIAGVIEKTIDPKNEIGSAVVARR